jgi:hypothetical protein
LDSIAARRLLALALFVGLVAETLLYGAAPGLNVPISVGVAILAMWLVRPAGARLDPLDRWIGPAAVGFALAVALRADEALITLDMLAALGLTVLAAPALGGEAVTRRSAAGVTEVGARTAVVVLIGAAMIVAAARPVIPQPKVSLRKLSPVARGLTLALPPVVIFALLFASADAVFERLLGDLIGLRIDLGDAPSRLVIVVALAWLAGGLLIVARREPAVSSTAFGEPSSSPAIPWPRLGAVEAIVIVAVVDLLFVLFVGLQIAYLFGARDTLDAGGLTYSDYARRGFFELVAAAALAGGLVAALDRAIAPRSRWFVGLAIGLMCLTAIVLVSAALRLRLYQEAYGWTELRFYVYAAIAWLGIGLASATALLLRDQMRRLGHALAAGTVVVAVAANMIGPTAYVAARNVERALDPSLVAVGGKTGFDAYYGAALDDDAIPAIAADLRRLRPAEQAILEPALRMRWIELRTDPAFNAPAAWNLGRERARSALDALFGS